MKYYVTISVDIDVSGEVCDEFVDYSGLSKEEAIKNAETQWNQLDACDKKWCRIEVLEYELSDDFDIEDIEELDIVLYEMRKASEFKICTKFSL